MPRKHNGKPTIANLPRGQMLRTALRLHFDNDRIPESLDEFVEQISGWSEGRIPQVEIQALGRLIYDFPGGFFARQYDKSALTHNQESKK